MIKKVHTLLENDTYFSALLIVLVGIGSFGLGKLSASESGGEVTAVGGLRPPTAVTIDTSARSASVAGVASSSEPAARNFVASKNGSRYHRLDCPGAKQMSEKNKIFFTNIEEARAAGYTPAANCPGLE